MGARRFFIERSHVLGDVVTMSGTDARKIVQVLRLRTGDRIEIVDSAARVYDATLRVDGATVHAALGELRSRARDTGVRIDVAQGVPKGQKMDFVIEKLTELGAATILPLVSERAIVRDAGAAKIERWRRLARAAAAQSGRDDIPSIEAPMSFGDVIGRCGDYDVVLFPWEVLADRPPPQHLAGIIAGARRILAVIGPEGGFSHDEAERAAAAGASLISLGRRILRTETAGLVLLSILEYLGDHS